MHVLLLLKFDEVTAHDFISYAMLILADHQRRIFTVVEPLKSLLLVVLDLLFESHLQGLSLIISEF